MLSICWRSSRTNKATLAKVRDDAARASGAVHDAKVLGETAMRLLG